MNTIESLSHISTRRMVINVPCPPLVAYFVQRNAYANGRRLCNEIVYALCRYYNVPYTPYPTDLPDVEPVLFKADGDTEVMYTFSAPKPSQGD